MCKDVSASAFMNSTVTTNAFMVDTVHGGAVTCPTGPGAYLRPTALGFEGNALGVPFVFPLPTATSAAHGGVPQRGSNADDGDRPAAMTTGPSVEG